MKKVDVLKATLDMVRSLECADQAFADMMEALPLLANASRRSRRKKGANLH